MSLQGGSPVAVLSAAGTRARPQVVASPGPGRRARLLVEIGLLFIAAPLLVKFAVFSFRLPLFAVLPPVLGLLILYLLWDDTFHLATELGKGFRLVELGWMLALFVLVGGALAWFVASSLPERFLGMPRWRPEIWRMVMLLYPLLSVLPQELIYRSFFFHRYGPLFGSARWLAIIVNGVLFGFGHIMFGSYVAVALTMLLGALLAWRYERTRSFWAVWVEHSLYGCLVFTVGIGFLFFTGVASVG